MTKREEKMNKEIEEKTPEIEVKEVQKPARKKAEPKPVKSKKRMNMKEYMLGKRNIRRETQAAIRVTLGNDLFHTKEEWDEIVKNHIND